MAVHLDRFSRVKAPIQGLEVRSLVNRNRRLLMADRPQTPERYRTSPRAIKNIARLAGTEGFWAYIIREEDKHGRARGLATLTLDQTVIHPQVGRVHGDNLDYWVDDDSDEDLHGAVAAELVYASAKRAFRMPGDWIDISMEAAMSGREARTQVFVSASEDAHHPPYGLFRPLPGMDFRLEKLGEPTAALTLPGGQKDVMNLTGGGELIQIYHGQGVVYERPPF